MSNFYQINRTWRFCFGRRYMAEIMPVRFKTLTNRSMFDAYGQLGCLYRLCHAYCNKGPRFAVSLGRSRNLIFSYILHLDFFFRCVSTSSPTICVCQVVRVECLFVTARSVSTTKARIHI